MLSTAWQARAMRRTHSAEWCDQHDAAAVHHESTGGHDTRAGHAAWSCGVVIHAQLGGCRARTSVAIHSIAWGRTLCVVHCNTVCPVCGAKVASKSHCC